MVDVFQVNAVGPLLAVQAFYPLLAATRPDWVPVIGVLSSKVGSIEDNGTGGWYAYRASKAALNIIFRSLHVDMAGRAAVALLHPGYVRTKMTGFMGFIDPPDSVAGMIKALEATGPKTGFRWVDYKAEIIPY